MQDMDYFKILKSNISNENLIKHCIAVKSIMEELAEYLGHNKQKWGICGLLHDIDYEKTKENPERHSIVGAEMLEKLGFEKDICDAVREHNSVHNLGHSSLMSKALYVSDALSGLIVASTLVLPSKKLRDVTVENVLNRFKEKSFAKGVNRGSIQKCGEYLGIPLREFVEIGIRGMRKESDQLGL